MRPLADFSGRMLRWTQTGVFSHVYELRTDDAVMATLEFRSSFGSLATGRAEDRSWTFKRIGFWRPRATVRLEDSAENLAVFEHSTWSGGGSLTLADHRQIQVTTGSWQTRIEFRDSDGLVLFRYHTEGFLRAAAELEILPPAARMLELSWLLLFGWYLVVMMHRDEGAAVAAVCACG